MSTITLKQCIAVNPAIGDLIKDATADLSSNPTDVFYRDYKERVTNIVGWSKKGDPVLGTSTAYDLVYDAVLKALGY